MEHFNGNALDRAGGIYTMEFYWNNVTEKSGLLKPSDITDCTVYARPIYARFTVCVQDSIIFFLYMTHIYNVFSSVFSDLGYFCPASTRNIPTKSPLPCPTGTLGKSLGLMTSTECVPCPSRQYCHGEGKDCFNSLTY
jgi:hypothetical protein